MARPKNLRETLRRGRVVARHLAPGVMQEKPLMAGAMLALVASVALQLLEPWPLKFVIDLIASAGPLKRPADSAIALAAIGLVAIVGLRATSDYYRSVCFALLGNRVTNRVRAKLYQHLQALSLSYHDQARTGDLLVRVIDDVKMIREVAVTALLPMLASIMMLAGMLAVMAWVNWRLTLLALSILPLFALSTIRVGRRIHDAARKQRQREGAMAATAAEALASVRTVQALSLESHFEDRFSTQNRKSLADGVKAQRLSARLERTADVLIAAASALVIWFGARQELAGQRLPGELYMFLWYLKRGFHPLQDLAKFTSRLAKATAAGERVVELLEKTPDVQDVPNAIEAPPLAGKVEIVDIQFAYDKQHAVYERLSLTVEAGQFAVICGESGAGKSTLLSLLLRLYDPQAGEIRIDNVNVQQWTLASLRGQVSVVLQDTMLFAGNVYDNIALGATDVSADEIEAAARLANAHDFIVALPQGYDTPLGERGVNLSKGQRQRIAIARAAVRRSPLLLLDEPTAGLDEQNEQAVHAALRRLAHGRTTLLVTHDLGPAVDADFVIFIADGRVAEQGTQEQLLARGGQYAAMYASQFGRPRFTPAEVRHGAVV